ncbi:hypothetical protein OYT88_10410 [Sporolactobacillus sp. CQH2019]|uniref:hypothetical protein n=1 Tax=Sporolactobacillus sp. CQH2019 TaxID=3023512 RepID=UPI00236848A3|nr:hypothetical protein [Sporolactobacillus sp. CQH2019]MDD9148963.1 hypothetical protein [Sporolactobacillus sp. CQH2019]
MVFAIYNNKEYEATIRNSKIRLKSRMEDVGFSELVDIAGNIHKDIYIKEVSDNKVELVYELNYKVIYKGMEFEPLAIGKFVLDQHYIMITTNDRDIAEKFQFEKKEPFVFDKQIPLNEIDALIEIKIPLLRFKNLGEERIRIESQDIKAYLLKQK